MAFAQHAAPVAGGLLGDGNDVSVKLQTVLGAALVAGLPSPAAWGLQAVAAAVAAAAVWRVWTRTPDPLHRAAALCAATPLATPYMLSYDLCLLVAPLVWITARALDAGLRPWERVGLVALWFAPAAVTATIGVLPATPILCAFLLTQVVLDPRRRPVSAALA